MGIRVLTGLASAFALSACALVQSPPEPIQIDRPSGAVPWADIDPRAIPHVNRRLDEIEWQPMLDGGVLFLGDSITEGAPLSTMFPGLNLRNQGIGWDTSEGVLARLNQVTRHTPERIFLLIGTNDTNYTDDPSRIAGNIETIATRLREQLPDTELYVVSVLPRNAPNNDIIPAVNDQVKAAAEESGFVFLDLASAMRAPNGEMITALSYDNLHLNVQGYAVWEEVLRACVWDGCPDGL
jgi:lysophospholipase L1-like esterase